mmetsp:Transcript_84557/g.217856  ORF Transcript_84557/g.217856 Transcript_84557/m.217856 type:complete len:277 (+) Transcript_84557:162-992(+)
MSSPPPAPCPEGRPASSRLSLTSLNLFLFSLSKLARWMKASCATTCRRCSDSAPSPRRRTPPVPMTKPERRSSSTTEPQKITTYVTWIGVGFATSSFVSESQAPMRPSSDTSTLPDLAAFIMPMERSTSSSRERPFRSSSKDSDPPRRLFLILSFLPAKPSAASMIESMLVSFLGLSSSRPKSESSTTGVSPLPPFAACRTTGETVPRAPLRDGAYAQQHGATAATTAAEAPSSSNRTTRGARRPPDAEAPPARTTGTILSAMWAARGEAKDADGM